MLVHARPSYQIKDASQTSENRMSDSINRVGKIGYLGKNPVEPCLTALHPKEK